MPPRRKQLQPERKADVPTRTRRGRPPSKPARKPEKGDEDMDIGDFQDGDNGHKRLKKGKTGSSRYSMMVNVLCMPFFNHSIS